MNIKAILLKDKRRPSTDGTYPIYIRVTIKGSRHHISLDKRVHETHFDDAAGRMRTKKPMDSNAFTINGQIDDKITEVNATYSELLKIKKAKPTVRQVKNKLAVDDKSFFEFGKDWIEKYNTEDSVRTYNRYRAHLNKLKNYIGSEKLEWHEIDPTFLRHYEGHLVKKLGNDVNTVHSTLKSIRAIFRAAMMEGVADKNYYPFGGDYKLKSKRTMKIALTSDELREIIALEIPVDTDIYHARSCFMLQYFFSGLRFADIATLTWGHLTADLRNINREMMKTGDVVSLEVPEPARMLLLHYRGMNPKAKDTDFVLPLLRRTDERLLTRVSAATARVNRDLKTIAGMTSIKKNLTTHVARHSFARAALAMDVNVKTIQMLLGHSNLNTTQVYLGMVSTPELSKANKLIANNL